MRKICICLSDDPCLAGPPDGPLHRESCPFFERYISTDDREIERVDAVCDHRRCPPGECRAYSEETLTPTTADEEKARELVAAGWWSTSAKYRHIARWKEPIPTVEELFRPEMLETFHGKRLAHFVRQHLKSHQYGKYVNEHDEDHEYATLSPSLFRAFKKAGGDCAR